MNAFKCDICGNYGKNTAPFKVTYTTTDSNHWLSTYEVDVCYICASTHMVDIARVLVRNHEASQLKRQCEEKEEVEIFTHNGVANS